MAIAERAPRVSRSAQRQTPTAALYEPLDSVLVRAPLLPIEVYHKLSARGPTGTDPDLPAALAFEPGSLLPADPRIRRALAVGSVELLNALQRTPPDSRKAGQIRGKLLRYLIRMSTRPTPFGMFAGVALGAWGDRTDLRLAALPRTRTRLDMSALLEFVFAQEARPDVRRGLTFVANTCALLDGDRVWLSERAPGGGSGDLKAVSVRATGVVRRALVAARRPIPYDDLVATLLASTPGATAVKVERLIDDLWRQTLLLTDLRPPLTGGDPAAYVLGRLAAIPAAAEAVERLAAAIALAAAWDRLSAAEAAAAYPGLLTAGARVAPAAAQHWQIDMALPLEARHIGRPIALEAARAAELLLRQSPAPRGPLHLAAYRRAFVARYGVDREAPLLHMLDPEVGLGPLAMHGAQAVADGEIQSRLSRREQALHALALTALRERRLVVDLDDRALERLETWPVAAELVPLSVDINVFVAACSRAALDRGEFQVIVGPNLGAQTAGRNLGRFADLLGREAEALLARLARTEAAAEPRRLCAELVYLPHRLRAANVVVRPAVHRFEIAVAAGAGVVPEHTIPPDELVVGVRGDRFYIRWPAADAEVVVRAGHMLNTVQAPPVCRFLAEVSRDREAQLVGFDWGSAESFPFLPRVQTGRIVLRLARWRIDRHIGLPDTAPGFAETLRRWRVEWQVPRHVYLASGDNRLLLDLDDPAQTEVLRAELPRLKAGGAIELQEALPAPDQVWLAGQDGYYMTELVVPLIRRGAADERVAADAGVEHGQEQAPADRQRAAVVPAALRLRPPGSDWLFVKLRCRRSLEEDLIGGPLRDFATEALAGGLADSWFFIRYADPDPHIRLRFHGRPERLTGALFPAMCDWAANLMTTNLCLGFSFETYEREVERYGGAHGMDIAERLFAADSRAVSEIVRLLQAGAVTLDRTLLGVLTVDYLLGALGLSEAGRLTLYREHVVGRHAAGKDYRQHKALLRRLLGEPIDAAARPPVEALAPVLGAWRAALEPVGRHLDSLAQRGLLTQPLSGLYLAFVHLHCNRLLGIDAGVEQAVLGLLLRTREGLERAR